MRTDICERLGIEFPIFAFTHCRDVVAAVSNAGGFGVLGVLGFTPEQIETELNWIDDHVGDRPYGVDVVIPGKYEGQNLESGDGKSLETTLRDLVPEEHIQFAKKLLADAGLPELPEEEQGPRLLGWTMSTAMPQIEVALQHDKVRMIANALGTPPQDVVQKVQGTGRLIGALCGTPEQAAKHKNAGLDFVVAQGTEAGGHCGDISSMVLWPQAVKAADPVPVLAAGGIGHGDQIAAALAMGCQGAWTGSLWLTVEEANTSEIQRDQLLQAGSRDTVRSRAYTGKPARMLRNKWTEAWERDDTPDPLPMPLQYMVSGESAARAGRDPEKGKDFIFNPVGQIVGELKQVRSSRDVVFKLVEEYLEAVERLNKLTAVAQ